MSTINLNKSGDMAADAAFAVEAILREALRTRGRASLLVSGGSSPKPLYEKLSQAVLNWSKVTISLVDERWVESGQAGSNEDFIRQTLIQNKASKANFFGLKTAYDTVESGLAAAEARFSILTQPFDVCVMGMGLDGHTASWFPNAVGLSNALSINNKNVLCKVNAAGASGAGAHPNRITLTLRSVLDAHAIILFIPGTEKRDVFDNALNKSLSEAPVQALLRAGSNLYVFKSPMP